MALTGVPELGLRGALDGASILWGAPTYDQVRIAWNEMRHGAGGVATFTQQRMIAELPTGGSVIFRSLDDPDNARGHTADGVLLDEAGDIKGAAWYEVLRPVLIDTNGWALVKGTPKGRNWFWREWMAAQDRDDSATWQVPTKGCRIEDGRLVRDPHPLENPDIPWDEIVHLFQTLPMSVFRQEILAEFLEGEGAVFRNIRGCIADPPAGPDPNRRYVMGVDWAQITDYTAFVVMDARARQVVDVDRFNQIGWDVQRDRLAALAERWRVADIWAEHNAIGGPNIEELQRQGLPVKGYQMTNQSKQDLIWALQGAFEREEIAILDNPAMIGELEAFEAVRTPSGKWRYSAPDGMHDDTVIALSLAYEAANRPAGVRITRGTRLYGSRSRANGRGLYSRR